MGKDNSPRTSMLYYRGRQLMAARLGAWKAHFKTQAGYGQKEPELHEPPLLFHLEHDPSEQYDVSQDHPEVIAQIRQLVSQHQAELVAPPSQLELY
ncbi:MAG: hypothetical protein WD845_11240 [Pirellulales bacterium]